MMLCEKMSWIEKDNLYVFFALHSYANRAKNIKNKPRINEDPKDALLRQFQEEIARLKGDLMKKGGKKKKRRKEKGESEGDGGGESEDDFLSDGVSDPYEKKSWKF